jgi:hypothetical protein
MHWLGDFSSLALYWISPFWNQPQDIKSLGYQQHFSTTVAPHHTALCAIMDAQGLQFITLIRLSTDSRQSHIHWTRCALLDLSTLVIGLSMRHVLPNTDIDFIQPVKRPVSNATTAQFVMTGYLFESVDEVQILCKCFACGHTITNVLIWYWARLCQSTNTHWLITAALKSQLKIAEHQMLMVGKMKHKFGASTTTGTKRSANGNDDYVPWLSLE